MARPVQKSALNVVMVSPALLPTLRVIKDVPGLHDVWFAVRIATKIERIEGGLSEGLEPTIRL